MMAMTCNAQGQIPWHVPAAARLTACERWWDVDCGVWREVAFPARQPGNRAQTVMLERWLTGALARAARESDEVRAAWCWRFFVIVRSAGIRTVSDIQLTIHVGAPLMQKGADGDAGAVADWCVGEGCARERWRELPHGNTYFQDLDL